MGWWVAIAAVGVLTYVVGYARGYMDGLIYKRDKALEERDRLVAMGRADAQEEHDVRMH